MKLTPENKTYIDGLSYQELLEEWRESPHGDYRFQGETGDYCIERMKKLAGENPVGAGAASKSVGLES